jgi:Trypsin-like peptidase domain
MRSKFYVILLLMAVTCLESVQAKPFSSVVKITCRSGGDEWVGTGFAWEKPTQIVTSLHVVAGCKGIEVESEESKDRTSAEVKKVLIASDLALLELKKSIGLTVLKIETSVQPENRYKIWGYPKKVETIQGDELRFSDVREKISTLEKIMSASDHERAVGKGGYPALKAHILRVGSTIQPGHSGAPITNEKYEVVAIGNGGLHEGIRSINWAIPTSSLKALTVSEDDKPKERPKQAVHYSVKKIQAESETSPDASGSLRHVFTTTLGNALGSTSHEDLEEFAQLLGLSADELSSETEKEFDLATEDDADLLEWDEQSGDSEIASDVPEESSERGADESEERKKLAKEMLAETIEVYEDNSTGATIALPKGVRPSYNPETHMVTASAAKGRLTVFVQILEKGGKDALKKFVASLDKKGDWKRDPEWEDEVFEKDSELSIQRMRYEGESPEASTKELFYSANVEGDSFLGTAYIGKNIETLGEKGVLTAMLLMACIELAGFRID